LTFGSQVDAAYVSGTLRFLSVARVRQFADIGPALTPATDAQLRTFAAHHTLYAPDIDAVLSAADDITRRRIAGLVQRNLLDRIAVPTILAEGARFEVAVETVTVDGKERVSLPTERAALKRLVNLLDENLFSSALTGDPYQAGSKRRLRRG
jgi:hypothetical protein